MFVWCPNASKQIFIVRSTFKTLFVDVVDLSLPLVKTTASSRKTTSNALLHLNIYIFDNFSHMFLLYTISSFLFKNFGNMPKRNSCVQKWGIRGYNSYNINNYVFIDLIKHIGDFTLHIEFNYLHFCSCNKKKL